MVWQTVRLNFMKNFSKASVLLWLILCFVFVIQAQTAVTKPSDSTVQELKLSSKLMAREMPYRVILPTNYEKAKENRYAVIFLLHGLTGHFDNWTDRTKIAEYAKNFDFIIVTPEGDNGWYSDSVTVASDKYESYIIQELLPEIDKKFRTISDREHRVIAGLSMGGYGSLKFGLKYPEKFFLVGSFSGALGAASFTEKTAGGIGKSIDAIFGNIEGENRKSNDIFKIVKEISPEKIKSLPFIYLDCGTEDFLFQNNRDFVALLLEKKIPHEFRQLPGKHDWVFWNSQVKEFLELSKNHLSAAKAKTD